MSENFIKTQNQENRAEENNFPSPLLPFSPSRKRVSVVIPAYNVGPFIAETLGSVFAQTFTDFEVLLVNDGSPDTKELEKAIKPFLEKVIYIKQENGGAAKARNAGVKAARGELIAFLDGDDIWLPEFLESQIAFLEQNNFDMVYADALIFGESVGSNQTYMQTAASRGEVTPESLILGTCNVITSGTVARREKICAAGLFDEAPSWRRGQDFEMWFRLAKRGAKIGYQNRVLLKYRVRREGLSGTSADHVRRDLNSLAGIKAKFELTPSEQAAVERQIEISQALLHIETGKDQILKGEFNAASASFAAANRFYRKPKLFFVGMLLKIAPRVLQRVLQLRFNDQPQKQAS